MNTTVNSYRITSGIDAPNFKKTILGGKKMFLIYDARTAEGYEEGFQECLSIKLVIHHFTTSISSTNL